MIRSQISEESLSIDAMIAAEGTRQAMQDNSGREKRNIDSTGASYARPTNEYVLNVAFFSFIAFVFVQTVFALIANSQSMLADSEAMAVDSLTYLFNLCAERIKKRPLTEAELRLTPAQRAYRRELRRLYLELVPPLISVSTLIAITVLTMKDAVSTLRGEVAGDEDDDVSVPIMLIFSFGNLLLDVVNVTCFARANSTFGLDVVQRENSAIRESLRSADEGLRLLELDDNDDDMELLGVPGDKGGDENYGSISQIASEKPRALINLNMCSAWTHVCADTLRSIAVLVAAAIATIFPSIDGAIADSLAAVAVSIIILISLVPLIEGLILTALQIHQHHRNPVSG